MKTSAIFYALFLSFFAFSCNGQQQTYDTDVTLLFDVTDKVKKFPTASDLLSPFDLKNRPLQGIRIKVSTISEKDFNNATYIPLEKEDEWSSNSTIRTAKIARFRNVLQLTLGAIRNADTKGHSIIYRQIVAQANRLAASKAKRKVLVIFSNLYENSDVNFYNATTMRTLVDDPAQIATRLQKQAVVGALKGLEIWIIYDPADYRDNNHFRPIAKLYQSMLNGKGAKTIIDTKFQLQ